MKKVLNILIITVALLSLFISCNDGEEGLFQMAASSVKKEAYLIVSILNNSGDEYIVATDNGNAKYNISDRSYSSFVGNGVKASSTIWASPTLSDYIYYDSTSKTFRSSDDSDMTALLGLEGITPQPFYSPDGIHFTYVFRTSDGGYRIQYLESAPAAFSDIFSSSTRKMKTLSLPSGKFVKVSIIGNGTYMAVTDGGEKLLIHYGDPSLDSYEVSSTDTDISAYLESDYGKDIYLDISGKLWKEGEEKSFGSTGLFAGTRPVLFKGSKYSYCIIPGSTSVIQINDTSDPAKTTFSARSVSGLQNVEIVAIISEDYSEDHHKLNVLTSDSGLRTIDFKAKTIN